MQLRGKCSGTGTKEEKNVLCSCIHLAWQEKKKKYMCSLLNSLLRVVGLFQVIPKVGLSLRSSHVAHLVELILVSLP